MARKGKPEVEEFSFDDILEEIESVSKEIECGPYRVTELTMQHQRKSYTTSLEPVEAPLRTYKLFNEYIRENVTPTESYGDVSDIVDVSERPYLINLLRVATLGREYKNGEKTYNLYEVTENDFNIADKTMIFACGSMDIRLDYPSLSKEDRINDQLSTALGPFKKRNLNDEDYGKIADLYNLYEIMKYLTSVTKDGNEILFDNLSLNNKKKFIDKLPIRYVEIIGEFIAKVKEHETKCFTAVNIADVNDTIDVDLTSIFSAKSL